MSVRAKFLQSFWRRSWFASPASTTTRRADRRRLGPRLLAAIVLASSVLALLATAIQLALDYRRDMEEIDTRFVLIDHTLADTLGRSLWSMDGAQIKLQLDSLRRVHDVEFARVSGQLGEQFTVGRESTDMKRRDMELRAPGGEREVIGTLTVGMGLTGVYHRLLDRALVIFVTQAAKTTLIALFILIIVRRWVTRHLEHLAAHARGLTADNMTHPLTLPRHSGRAADEIDDVAQALNDLSHRLATELDRRSVTEAELREHRDHLEDLVGHRTAELQQAVKRAEAANAAKSEFLSRMSHELRTPLNAVLGYAQVLLMNGGLSDKQASGLNIIRSSGEHLLGLIVDILDLARIEAGRADMNPGEMNLRAFVRSVADMVRIKAEEKQLALRIEIDDGLPGRVWVDEQRLRQVLLNLLGNAVKFTDRGEVGLRVAAAATPGLALRFEVRDTGIGIAQADRERMFEPFEQGGDLHRRSAGTGLGLAISRQLVRQMGSEIRLEAPAGGGSLFWFEAASLPAAQPPTPATSATNAAPAPSGYEGKRRSVLVVDDIDANRTLLRELLVELGFEVHEAGGGLAALSLLGTEPIDLVLIDMAMPGMDGLETLRAIRLDARTSRLPVLVISAHTSDADARRANEAGADGFIAKPIAPAQVLEHMAALLGLHWTY